VRKYRKALPAPRFTGWAVFWALVLIGPMAVAEVTGFQPVAAAELKSALAQYRAMTRLKVAFKQKKFLKDMDLALESQGDLDIKPPNLVVYRITKPTKMTVTLTPEEIKIENGGDTGTATVQTIKTGAIPGEAEKRSLQAMVTWLKLDPDALASEYAVARDDRGGFRFEPRKPEQSPFQNLRMQLSKNGHLKQLTMHEKSGDRIEFIFDNPKVTNQKP